VEFLSFVERVGDIESNVDLDTVTQDQIEANIVRCPDKNIAKR